MRQLSSDGLIAFAELFVKVDYSISCYRVGNALDLKVAVFFAMNHVLHVSMSLVRYEDLTRRAGGLQPRGKIHAGADDRIIHSCLAAEVSNRADARVDPNPAP